MSGTRHPGHLAGQRQLMAGTGRPDRGSVGGGSGPVQGLVHVFPTYKHCRHRQAFIQVCTASRASQGRIIIVSVIDFLLWGDHDFAVDTEFRY